MTFMVGTEGATPVAAVAAGSRALQALPATHEKKNLDLFGFLFDLDKFLTLKNENKFSFSSLIRNFALSLQREML